MVKKNSSSKKRWRKGHSSSSNPETKNHREAAKSRFFVTSSSVGEGARTGEYLYDRVDYIFIIYYAVKK